MCIYVMYDGSVLVCVECDVCIVCTQQAYKRRACVVYMWGCRDVCERQRCLVCLGGWHACDEEMVSLRLCSYLSSPNLDPMGTLRTNDTRLTPSVQRAGKSNKTLILKRHCLASSSLTWA